MLKFWNSKIDPINIINNKLKRVYSELYPFSTQLYFRNLLIMYLIFNNNLKLKKST